MRVLVTGGSGFLGGYVLRELVRRGHSPVALVRSDTAAERVNRAGADPIRGDLDGAVSLGAVFSEAKADALANLASMGFGHAPAIVSAAQASSIRRTVFVSTTAIFTTLPAASRTIRVSAEETVRGSGLEWTIVRPTMIYGAPGDRNMERLLRMLRRSPVMLLPGGGEGLLQPVHVEDLASFVVTALVSDESVRKCYEVAGPEALTLRQVVEHAAVAVGRRPKVIRVPLAMAVAPLRVYERLASRPRLRVEQVLRLSEDKAFDITEAKALGYAPRPFADGIAKEAVLLS